MFVIFPPRFVNADDHHQKNTDAGSPLVSAPAAAAVILARFRGPRWDQPVWDRPTPCRAYLSVKVADELQPVGHGLHYVSLSLMTGAAPYVDQPPPRVVAKKNDILAIARAVFPRSIHSVRLVIEDKPTISRHPVTESNTAVSSLPNSDRPLMPTPAVMYPSTNVNRAPRSQPKLQSIPAPDHAFVASCPCLPDRSVAPLLACPNRISPISPQQRFVVVL